MFQKILFPVDLKNVAALDKALRITAELSKTYSASVCYVGVTTTAPSDVARTPQEFTEKLEVFSKSQADAFGIVARAHVMTSHDPTADLTQTLKHAVDEVGADLVVMATHIPGAIDDLWASHGGGVAAGANVSVFLVR